MVLYGLAEMELLEQDFFTITIAEDLRKLLIPHIDWALEYEHNQQRMSVEIIVEGLANILGIVTQDEIRKYHSQSEDGRIHAFPHSSDRA